MSSEKCKTCRQFEREDRSGGWTTMSNMAKEICHQKMSSLDGVEQYQKRKMKEPALLNDIEQDSDGFSEILHRRKEFPPGQEDESPK